MMTRATFFRTVFLAPLIGIAQAFPTKREFHADYRRHDLPSDSDEHRLLYGKCFVNGREIRQCWYIDTAEGVVKSYDVRGTGQFYQTEDHKGVQAVTLRGKIQLFDSTGKRLY